MLLFFDSLLFFLLYNEELFYDQGKKIFVSLNVKNILRGQ